MSLENTVGQEEMARNEKFLLFPQWLSHPFGELSAIFIKFEIVVCKLFQFGSVQNLLIYSPDDKIQTLSKLKAFADKNLNVTKNKRFVLEGFENNLGKGENILETSIFSCATMFSNGFFLGEVQRSSLCSNGLNIISVWRMSFENIVRYNWSYLEITSFTTMFFNSCHTR